MRIIDHFDNGCRLYPDNIAFVDVGTDDDGISYAEAQPASHAIAAAIHARGYSQGGHVGVLAPNCSVTFLALLGLFRAQCVWLPINPRNTLPVNADLLERFDGELLLFHSSYAGEAEQLLAQCPAIKEIVCIDAISGIGGISKAMQQWAPGAGADYQSSPSQLDDTFAIFPTGGTTGKSKGVVLSHRNINAFFSNYYTHFNYHDDSCHLVVAPMTHTAGLTGCLHFARGGTNAIMSNADPSAIAEAIEQFQVTHLFLPPTVLYMMLALPDIRQRNYGSLRHFLVGAAPTALNKLEEALAVFGPVMTEAFGQCEAPASITAKAPWDYVDKNGRINAQRLGSIGRPCVFNTVAILDDDGIEQPRGSAGEICLRGDLVSPGYYQDPAATAAVRAFGWHHTGDIGIMSDDGYITLIDRKSDMIITGGFNVFPNEVEQTLSQHPAVQECAVIGVPDEKWGEAIKAVIQLKPELSCTEEELISAVKIALGSIKSPKSIDFVGDLPRSSAGKVLKTALRKPYWEGRTRAIN